MISRRQIISRSAGLIFAIFTSNDSVLGVDDRSGPLFFNISRDVAMATNFGQNCGKITYPPALIGLTLRNAMGYRLADERIKAPLIAVGYIV